MRQRRREAMAKNSSSSKVHRREGYLSIAHIKPAILYYVALSNWGVVLLLLRQRRGAAGNGLGTTIKYLRRTTRGAAGNDLGTTIEYLRGAAGIGLGTTIEFLRRTTSAAAGSGLSRCRSRGNSRENRLLKSATQLPFWCFYAPMAP